MNQNDTLLSWLQSHDGITTLEATIHLGICRLSERVRELEREPYHCSISHDPEKTSGGARVIRYRLDDKVA